MGSLCCLNRKDIKMDTNPNIDKLDAPHPMYKLFKIIIRLDADYATDNITEDYIKK